MAANHRITALGSVSYGWLHKHGGFLFDEAFFLDPQVRLEREREIHAFVAKRFPRDPIYCLEGSLGRVEGRQHPVVLVGGIQPNLILGAAVGAKFVYYGNKDPDITPTPLAELRDLDSLTKIDWPNTWPINLFLEQVRSTRELLGDSHKVIPPFFWDTTYQATVHGIITTAQKLMGERIFLELVDNPSFVHEFFQWIVDTYIELIRLFADAAAIKVKLLHVGECSACMIGPDQFAEFILPHLNALVRQTGPLRLHTCGFSDHLLTVFPQVENLVCLNVGSNTSVAKIRKQFGPMRIDVLPDAQLVTVGQPADVDAWVRKIVEENGDGELEFQYHLDLGQPEANYLQIHHTLESLGITTPRVEIH